MFESISPLTFYSSLDPDWERMRDGMLAASFALVGVTGMYANDFWAIEAAAEFDRPCGLLLKSPQMTTWAALSTMHRMRPFAFVVAIGAAPRHPERFFTGVIVFSAFDLEHGGKNLGASISELTCCSEFA